MIIIIGFITYNCICCGSSKLVKSPALMSLHFAKRMFGWTEFKIKKSDHLVDYSPGHSYPSCNTVFCEECDALFMDIRPDKVSMKRYYQDYQSSSFFEEREQIEPSFKIRRKKFTKNDIAGECLYLHEVEKYISNYIKKPNSILDWGGGDGSGTPFKSTCNNIKIHDINSKNLNVSAKNKLKHIKYDLIVCRHVIEHVSYPLKTLKEILSCCSSNTILYLEIPYENIIRLGRTHYHEKKIWTEHINLFSEISIKKLLEKLDLHVENLNIYDTGFKSNGYDYNLYILQVIIKF